jgi:AcrR family transcriptional regulator
MSTEAYQRARRPEQKLERRDAILGAAGELALRDGVRNVSLADIGAQVGIHKSALLRYFETREQIFLELTAGAWRDWAAGLHAALDDLAAAPAAHGPGSAPAAVLAPAAAELVANAVAGSFGERPLLCDLIAHTPLNLERNVSTAAVRRYKLTSLGAVQEAAGLVQAALPALTSDECREFISAMASLAGALWQISTPTPALAELYVTDPELVHARVELTPRLRRTAQILLAGLIPSRTQR